MAGSSQPPLADSLQFLAGGGEMGALMRAHDWSRSALGGPSTWSQALRTAVRIMLNCGHPMYIFWGVEGSCLYNDAYRLSIGPERHPGSLGRPAMVPCTSLALMSPVTVTPGWPLKFRKM